MNYNESEEILKKVKSSEKILINCHRRPDPDSVSCAISLYLTLKKMGKTCHVISPDPILESLLFLPEVNNIEVINYKEFNFQNYDLFMILDSPSWDFVTGAKDSSSPEKLFKVLIDHHDKRTQFTDISIINPEISSCAEVLFSVYKDWGVKFDKEIATSLLAGIIGDTLCFKIPLTSAKTLSIASELIKLGADRQYITDKLFSNMRFDLVKFLGEVLQRTHLEKDLGFVWSAIPYETFVKFNRPEGAKNQIANMFFGSTYEGKFGVLMIEEKLNTLMLSLRSAGRFNTLSISTELGGGGHKDSSAAVVEGMQFDDAVQKVLKVAREHARRN